MILGLYTIKDFFYVSTCSVGYGWEFLQERESIGREKMLGLLDQYI